MIPRTSEDFRLILINKLADIIWFKVTGLRLLETQRTSSRVLDDIGRSSAWLEMLASRVKDEYDLTKLQPRYGDYSKMNDKQEKKEMERIDKQNSRRF